MTQARKGAFDPVVPVPNPLAAFDQAVLLATQAHAGQVYGRTPYILHPLRVASTVLARGGDMLQATIAVLHDTIEDTWVTEDYLRGAGFPESVISVLRVLTHTKGEPYPTYIRRVALSPDATAIKLADISDNLAHLSGIRDPFRVVRLRDKYEAARAFLTYGQ